MSGDAANDTETANRARTCAPPRFSCYSLPPCLARAPCSLSCSCILLAHHCGDLACLRLTTTQTANNPNPNPAYRPAAGLDLGSERTPPPLGEAFREAASGERPARGGLLVEIPVPRVRRAALAAVLRCYGADGTWRDRKGGGRDALERAVRRARAPTGIERLRHVEGGARVSPLSKRRDQADRRGGKDNEASL